MLNLTNILAAGGVLAIFTLPGAIWALIGYGATCRRLEERNAAQGQTIAGLQARLNRQGGFQPWPRDEGEKLLEPVQSPAVPTTQAERQRWAETSPPELRRHWAHVSPFTMIRTTDATLTTAVDPAQQAELDRFHANRQIGL